MAGTLSIEQLKTEVRKDLEALERVERMLTACPLPDRSEPIAQSLSQPESLSVRVLDAMKHGARTSLDVSSAANMSIKTASAIMSKLEADGWMEKTGDELRYPHTHCRRSFLVYRLKKFAQGGL